MPKITSLQLENVKRVRAMYLEPTQDGLTIIGGRNKQGKTSVLDAIAWALGGAKNAPSRPQSDGAMTPPHVRLTLDNGLVVERKGRNSNLTVVDPSGKKAGQTLLDSFVSQFALNLPAFLNAGRKEKAEVLLDILGIGPELKRLEDEAAKIYNERHGIGQVALSKRKHADELPEFPDAPEVPYSISDLVREQQDILARNGEKQRLRLQLQTLEADEARQRERIVDLQKQVEAAVQGLNELVQQLETARKSEANLTEESTAEIEESIANVEGINAQVAANAAKAAALDEATDLERQYATLTARLEAVRQERLSLLEGAQLPLTGLAVENGELYFKGQPWDGMSSAEQLMVAVAIVRRLKPECGFVLVDKLEQMDLDSLKEFGAWLEEQGLQCIATRVSTGSECQLIIEDGLPAGKTYADVVTGVDAVAEDINLNVLEDF